MTHARMWVGAVVVVGLLGVLGLSGSLERGVGVAGADSAVKKVKCDKGQTLTEALRKAKPGDTLQVTGTCQERVTITTDRLTLDGGGSAVLDGGGGGPTEFEGVVTIDGAQGVTLTGFTDPERSRRRDSRRARRGLCGAAHDRAAECDSRHCRRGWLDGRPHRCATVKGNGGMGIDVFTSSTCHP